MENKQLTRTRDGRMIAGVCSGAGAYFGIDPNIIRLVLGISLVFGGAGALIYGVAWLIVPEEGKPTSVLQDLINKQQVKNP